MHHRTLLAGVLVLGLWASGAAAHDHDRDRNLAEQLQSQGEVLPLQTVLQRVEHDYPGQVMKVEFEHEDDCRDPDGGRRGECWVYELKILQSEGRLTKLEIDARTGDVLRVRTRPARGDKGHS